MPKDVNDSRHVVVDAFGCKVVAVAQNDKDCFGPFWALYRARHLLSSLGAEICEPRLIDLCTLARVTLSQAIGPRVDRPMVGKGQSTFFQELLFKLMSGIFSKSTPSCRVPEVSRR